MASLDTPQMSRIFGHTDIPQNRLSIEKKLSLFCNENFVVTKYSVGSILLDILLCLISKSKHYVSDSLLIKPDSCQFKDSNRKDELNVVFGDEQLYFSINMTCYGLHLRGC